nr:hypothetical protein [Allomuricauda sp.]
MLYDITILTDPRYLHPVEGNIYIDNVIAEDRIVQEALERIGLSVTRKAWDDPNFDWATTKYALFRATWDYFDRYEEFFKWLQNTKKLTVFINSAELVSWNIDKHYFKDLESKGVRIPKTLFVEPGTKTTLEQSIKKATKDLVFVSKDLVLKPCIAGGARHTYKFNASECHKHETIFQELIAQEAMMLQEFQKNIMDEGEISMMVFDGKFTHAVLKIAKPGDFRVQDDYGGTIQVYKPSKEEILFSENVVKACSEMPLYARVDIFKDNEGQWALAELEIFEPELWFRLNPKAADVLAQSIQSKMAHEEVL